MMRAQPNLDSKPTLAADAPSADARKPLAPQLLDWVALFERLGEDDRDSLIEHFRALGTEDRRLRFGVAVDDDFLARYVRGIDFERDEVFGARSAPGQWVGIGHLALDADCPELGLSVLAGARGHGLGAAIFRYAVARAARAGRNRLYMHCLTSNRSIISIANRAGMAIRHDAAGTIDAYLEVPPYPAFVRMLVSGH